MTPRPNLLLIISDDHGYADRSAHSTDPDVRTPALDALAARGVECTQAYVAAPICSPSRAAIISGTHPARWGVRWFENSRFPDHLPSMAELVRDNGYSTAYLGKVHYGPERRGDRATPPHHGFDVSYYGLAGQQMGRLNYLRHSTAACAEYGDFGATASAVQPMLEGDQEVDLEGFLTDELGRRAEEFIRATTDTPFFLTLAFNAVHNFCWQLPPEELQRRGLPTRADYTGPESDYLSWYDGHIAPDLDHGRAYYLAQLELMDTQIGRVLRTLDETGAADNTLVIYLTDNGGSTCNFADNTPLRGTKYTLWEGGVRVPFLASWPDGGIPQGDTHDGVVSSLDLLPTLLSAAGAAPSTYTHCDGHDLLPHLRGETPTVPRTLHWDNDFQWSLRHGNWKLLTVDHHRPEVTAIRTIEHTDPGAGTYLFDLAQDPCETTNLAPTHPHQVAELTRLHQEWRTATWRSDNAGTSEA